MSRLLKRLALMAGVAALFGLSLTYPTVMALCLAGLLAVAVGAFLWMATGEIIRK